MAKHAQDDVAGYIRIMARQVGALVPVLRPLQHSAMLERHWDQVTAVAEALLRYETISADDVEKLMKGERISKPTVAELLASETTEPPGSPSPQPPNEDTDEDLGGMLPTPA